MTRGNAAARAAMTLVALAALATAGCTTHTPATTPAQHSAQHSARHTAQPGRPSPEGALTPPPSLTPRQQAEDEAVGMLKSFAVPPGAGHLNSPPQVTGAVLTSPIQTPQTPDLVDRATWFTAPGSPGSVLGWEAKHIPHEFKLDGAVTSDGPRGVQPTLTYTFSMPQVAGVIDSRRLLVEVVLDGAGTAIRVDAQVTWLPARPAGEQVPAGAGAVTIALNLGVQKT